MVVSALITPHGTTGQAVRAGLQGHYRMIVCPHLLAELDEVLRRPSFRRWFSEDDATEFIIDFSGTADVHPDPSQPPTVSRDPDDDYLLALVGTTNADVLVTGDDDLLSIDQPGIDVITPRQLLARINKP